MRRGPREAGDTFGPTTRLSPAVVKRRLNAALRKAFISSGKGQVFLELFAGSSRLARALAKNHGHACLGFDVKNGLEYDLCNPAVVNHVLGWVSSRMVRGVWLGTPCSTWSRARRRPLRDFWNIYGLHDLPESDRAKLSVGNATLASARRVIRSCRDYRVPCIMENPATSQMWSEPMLNVLLQDDRCQAFCLDYCCFGAPWRKRTRLAGWGCSEPRGLCRLCTGVGGKCWTGKRHRILQGSVPGSSLCWTHLAEAYPPALATQAAAWLARSADALELSHLQQLAGLTSKDV